MNSLQRNRRNRVLPPVGKRFGTLTVGSRSANDRFGRVRFLCKCDCGKERIVRLTDLLNGHTKSCGCLRKLAIRRRLGKIVLKNFGMLTALGKAHPEQPTSRSTEWATGCNFCPRIVFATSAQLRSGRRRCECLEATYNSWRNMIQRCTNKNHEQYQDYGGRGITVCEQWRRSFLKFVQDMGKRPKGKSLDRRDPNGSYTPDNCCWADAKEQANNRRRAATSHNSQR